jgi:uncharacterized protein DUF1579
MKLSKTTFAVCAALLWAGAAVAQDAKPAEKKGAPPAMSAEEKAQMDAWMKFAAPAEAHKGLEGMVGTWDAEVTSWMSPGQPPMKSKGTSDNRLVLGGRWVESRFHGDMMGMPFEGLGYTGYDNYKKKYMGTWMDNMSTAVMISEGTMDAGNKVMTSTSTMDDVMTGKKATVRMVTTIVDPNTHLFEMYGPDPASGKEVKQMEIKYTRKK